MTETLPRNYDTIPGTFVFDGKRARRGHPLNRLCMTLNDPANRDHFRRNPEAYMARFGLSNEQRDAVRRRDWISMLELGGNIYFIAKIAILDGMSMQDLGAAQSGVTTDEFTQMMLAGGRKPRG
jgi:protocatechuate 4,5-dioxygenase alpha chain